MFPMAAVAKAAAPSLPRESQRSPAMVMAQVYSAKRVPASSLAKGPDKDKWDALAKELAAFDADKPKPPPTAMAMSAESTGRCPHRY